MCTVLTDATPGPVRAVADGSCPHASAAAHGAEREIIAVMKDYLVAAHDTRRPQTRDQIPELKGHAYLPGMLATMCGFGLKEMRCFEDLHFSQQPPEDRCPICARRTGSDH